MTTLLNRFAAWLSGAWSHFVAVRTPAVDSVEQTRESSFEELAELQTLKGLQEAAQRFYNAAPPAERKLVGFTEASGDWRLEFDSPYQKGYDYERLGILGSYTLLREWNIYERQAILERCHMAHERNPLANTAVGLTTLFVVGKGLNITYQNPDVQAVIEDFVNDPENSFQASQKEFCNQLQTDGEVFIRFYSADGRTLVASLQPWFIKWIEVDPQFRKRVVKYRLMGTFSNGAQGTDTVNEEIEPSEILHIKINAFNYELRGRPELFRILPWLKAYKDWLEERARINRRQGSMYFDMTLKNATPAQVSAARSAYKTPPPPASIFVHNDNVALQAVGGQVRASDAAQDGREMKLMALAGVNLPEYMFGEGKNSTKATSSTQELPALAKFEDLQTTLVGSLYKPMLKRVIQNAIDAYVIPEIVPAYNNDGSPTIDKATGQPKMVRAVDAFDCDFPDLRTPDPLTLAQALQIHVASGWASNETASMTAGYDYDAEQEKIQRDQQKSMAAAYAGGGVSSPPVPATGEPTPANDSGPAMPAKESDEMNRAQVDELIKERLASIAHPAPAMESHLHIGKLEMSPTPELIEAMRQPAPVVNVAPPVVNVAPAVVQYHEAEHPAPVVNVAAPNVTVESPTVNVAAPAVPPAQVQVVENAPRKTIFSLIKDKDGETVGVEKVEA